MSRIPVWPFESGGLTLKNLAFATLTLAPLAVIYLAGQNIYRHYTAPDVHFMQASQLRIDETVNVRDRKKAFFDFMRPVVEAENRRILKLRRRILAARQAGQRPAWVAAAAKDYGIEWSGNEWRALLRRVDVLPLELALVQSANESSWGRSRFAQQGNNMFGQWCFRKGCGMVPKRRTVGTSHEVAAYGTVNASVRAYLKNINTTPAYRLLRELRQRARRRGMEPTASQLAGGLAPYSERGAAYVSDIRAMLKSNRALMLDADTGS